MLLGRFVRDRRGSATRWFAYGAFLATALCVAGAHGLSALVKSGRVPIIAFVPAPTQAASLQTPADVDPLPTSSIGTAPQGRSVP